MNPHGSQPVQRSHQFDGLDFAYFEWGEPAPGRPSLLFVHATGFHGRVWDDIIERFPYCHAIAYELHGHGRSEGGPIEHTRELIDPLTAFVAGRDHRFSVGVGHSMGAHALVAVAAETGAFERLLLIDPTIFTPESYRADAEYRAAFTPGNAPSERRRREFPSPEAMKEALIEKGSFAVYKPRIYDDYCRFGLIEQADGSYQLACAPEMEASVYICARSNAAIFDCVHSLEIPVFIMRAQERSRREPGHMDFAFSPTWPELVKEFSDARETYYPQLTHFIAMQDPDEVERVLKEEIASLEE
jgi:pimeloyl-ACP methyl ester carboxylesterase